MINSNHFVISVGEKDNLYYYEVDFDDPNALPGEVGLYLHPLTPKYEKVGRKRYEGYTKQVILDFIARGVWQYVEDINVPMASIDDLI